MSAVIEQGTPVDELTRMFGGGIAVPQVTRDGVPTYWIDRTRIHDVLKYFKTGTSRPFRVLYDLTAIDERVRVQQGEPACERFTVVYHLLSYDRNADVRLKVALRGEPPSVPSATDIWPSANWYEREVWDMFGVKFEGHPHLTRILMPPTWAGHPLRKDHPARATEMGPFRLPEDKEEREQEALRFDPESWGMKRSSEDSDFMFLNIGPQHPGTHGVLRFALQLDGEEIVDVVPISVITIAVRRKWASANHGTLTSRTRTGSTTSAA